MATSYYNDKITFDINQFNQSFDAYLEKEKSKRLVTEQKFLEAKDIIKKEKLLHEYTIYELVIQMKNVFFDTIDDIASLKINKETFLKENRIFYWGLLIILFAIMLIIIQILLC